MSEGLVVEVADGLEWLRRQDSAAMVYLDPPYGHGTFGDIDIGWISSLVTEGRRIVGATGIVYLHGDPQLLWAIAATQPAPRGVIAWKNGWVSGFKSRSTKFWPRQYQQIAGWAGDEWRLRPVPRPAEDYRGVSRADSPNRKANTKSFVYSDWWETPNPVDQMSWSKEKLHYPTQKPLGLLERLILGSTDLDGLVLDPTCGSGTSLVAAVRVGRRASGADISPEAIAIVGGREAA